MSCGAGKSQDDESQRSKESRCYELQEKFEQDSFMCILITTEDWVILKKSCKGATSLTTVGVRSNTRFRERYRSLMDYESDVKLYMK